MTSFYSVTFAVSLLMLLLYFRIDRKRDIWLLLLFVSVAVSNAGYLGLSMARSLPVALAANAVAYLGNVFLPFFLLMMVLKLSYVRYPRYLPGILIGLNLVMFLIATSGGYCSVYYREVSLRIVDGAAHLVKVYGPLHGLYKVFVFGYFGAIVAVIIDTGIRKTAVSTKHTAFLASVLLGNIALWIVENLTGLQYEFLTISYLMTEGLILLLYGILQDYEALRGAAAAEAETAEREVAIPQTDDRNAFSDAQIAHVLARWPQTRSLTQRETEVLRFLLEKRKRKDIAQLLFVTESTIKKHTSNIYKKLDVADRTELFEKASAYLTQ